MSDFFHEYLPGDPRERIKDLLLERKITQAQLAETIGISESTLNRYLSGQTEKIPVDHIVAIARFFKVSTDFLLGLTDIPFVTNFDIEKLGLSVGAAKKLLQRKVDPALVSQLIEMPAFNLLIVQLGAAKRGTFDAGYDYMMEMFGAANPRKPHLFVFRVQRHPFEYLRTVKCADPVRSPLVHRYLPSFFHASIYRISD